MGRAKKAYQYSLLFNGQVTAPAELGRQGPRPSMVLLTSAAGTTVGVERKLLQAFQTEEAPSPALSVYPAFLLGIKTIPLSLIMGLATKRTIEGCGGVLSWTAQSGELGLHSYCRHSKPKKF